VEILQIRKFPLARRLRNLTKYTHAAQKPPRPRGLPAGRPSPKWAAARLRAANSADSCWPKAFAPKAGTPGDASKHHKPDWRQSYGYLDLCCAILQHRELYSKRFKLPGQKEEAKR
jgi:hypothetical protein